MTLKGYRYYLYDPPTEEAWAVLDLLRVIWRHPRTEEMPVSMKRQLTEGLYVRCHVCLQQPARGQCLALCGIYCETLPQPVHGMRTVATLRDVVHSDVYQEYVERNKRKPEARSGNGKTHKAKRP